MREWICGRCYTRLTGETAGTCPSCGGEDVVPAGSPRGAQLAAAVAPAPPPPPVMLPPPIPVAIKDGHVVCPNCYAVGWPKRQGPSSAAQIVLILIAVVGFLFFWPFGLAMLLIVIVYSLVPSKTVCAKCGALGVVPGSSPRAQELLSGRR